MLRNKAVKTIVLAACLLVSSPVLAFAPVEPLTPSFNPTELRPSYGATDAWLSVKPAADGQLVLASYSPAPSTPRVETNYGIFGSVALPVATLPAARKWEHASAGAFDCRTVECTNGIGRRFQSAIVMASNASTYEALTLINSSVNNLIRYRSDQADMWSTPAETIASGAGDCEDFAIAKMSMLLEAGFDSSQLQLVVLRNKKSRAFHAVLVVHTNGASYVLDNLSNRVLQDKMLNSYVPIQSFVGDRIFIHGFENRTTASASLAP